jgi:polysaccharide export outer membrane protein
MAGSRLLSVVMVAVLALCWRTSLADTEEASTPTSSAVPADYRIGPGDTLQVFVWRNPELTVTVPVRPDGKISTPLVEDMVAVGKTPSALARDIEGVLSEYVRSPQVNVIVTVPASVYSQVKVLGQVLHPQAVAYRAGMTVLDAVLAVGGLTQFAAGNRAKIVRSDGSKSRRYDAKPRVEAWGRAYCSGEQILTP